MKQAPKLLNIIILCTLLLNLLFSCYKKVQSLVYNKTRMFVILASIAYLCGRKDGNYEKDYMRII